MPARRGDARGEMSTPPPIDGMAPLARLARLRERYGAVPRARRELTILALELLFGLTAMPFLIWYAGSRVLGPYAHGDNLHAGPFALAGTFMLGLLHGSAVFWFVALGPALLLSLVRVLVALLRIFPSAPRD
jgi:hypothetical protein